MATVLRLDTESRVRQSNRKCSNRISSKLWAKMYGFESKYITVELKLNKEQK